MENKNLAYAGVALVAIYVGYVIIKELIIWGVLALVVFFGYKYWKGRA